MHEREPNDAAAGLPPARRRAGRRGRADQPSTGAAAGAQRGLPGDQVAEHRAGLDRRELVGVADQDQPASGRSASSSRAIRVSDTIDASSTTTTS